jgi:hypothetical protein
VEGQIAGHFDVARRGANAPEMSARDGSFQSKLALGHAHGAGPLGSSCLST